MEKKIDKNREPNWDFAKWNTLWQIYWKLWGRPKKRTYEKLRSTCDDFLERSRNWIPYKDKNNERKKSPVYFKKKLAIYKDFSWLSFLDAVRHFEEQNKDKDWNPNMEFSIAISEMEEMIENRLFEAGLSKKSDASIVRLWLSANYGRTTDRVKNEVSGKDWWPIQIFIPDNQR